MFEQVEVSDTLTVKRLLEELLTVDVKWVPEKAPPAKALPVEPVVVPSHEAQAAAVAAAVAAAMRTVAELLVVQHR